MMLKKIRSTILLFAVVLFLPSSGHSANTEPGSPLPAASHCDSVNKICWWVDGQGTLHGLRDRVGLGAWLIQQIIARPSDPQSIALQLEDGIPLSTMIREQDRYNALRSKLAREWSVAARSIVSDTVHADLQTMALAALQVSTVWNQAVSEKLNHDIDAENHATAVLIGPLMMTLTFALPVSALVQNYLFYALLHYALPLFLQSANYPRAEIPNAISASIHDLEVSKLKTAIAQYTDFALTKVALEYLVQKDGEAQLQLDTQDQSVQVKRLEEATGLPMQLSDAQNQLNHNHDFRLAFAAKLATVLTGNYEQALNNFIVTGYFGELAWSSTGALTTGTIFDLYLNPDEPVSPTRFNGGLFADDRRKRTWSFGPHGLEFKDHGPFMEGRGLVMTELVLPYWDEPVKSVDDPNLVLHGDPSITGPR